MDAENDFLLHVYGACLINEFTYLLPAAELGLALTVQS